MKPRQLANILIKILGLSLCAHGLSPAIQMLWQIYGPGLSSAMPGNMLSMLSGNISGYFLANLAPVGIGVIFIIFSKTIAALLISDEE